MSYKNLVNRNIALAFKLVKDLADAGTLVKTAASSFNFNTQSAVITPATPIPVSVIITDTNKSGENRNVTVYQLLFRVAEITSINQGDKITISSLVYTIQRVIRSDRFLFYVEAIREGV